MKGKPKNKDEPKNKGGRPPYYSTPEQMQKLIDEYFEKCDGKVLLDEKGAPLYDKYGNVVFMDRKPYTVAGLALALGFTSRQSLLNYQDKPEFVDTLTRAKLRIEVYTNERLFDKDGVQGSKFSLINNFVGYADKQDIQHSGEMGVKIVDDIK